MRHCTPLGTDKLKRLPVQEFHWLKQVTLECFPEYWCDVPAFEQIWKSALEHSCSSLRQSNPVSAGYEDTMNLYHTVHVCSRGYTRDLYS